MIEVVINHFGQQSLVSRGVFNHWPNTKIYKCFGDICIAKFINTQIISNTLILKLK